MPETADDIFAAVATKIVSADPRVASPATERRAIASARPA
jgi:hypothetical protein